MKPLLKPLTLIHMEPQMLSTGLFLLSQWWATPLALSPLRFPVLPPASRGGAAEHPQSHGRAVTLDFRLILGIWNRSF